MSEITVRFAGPEDGDTLAALVDAMDRYYEDPERNPGETRAAANRWLRGEQGDTRFVLALTGDTPLGLAVVGVLYPGNALKGLLFLKDLFVSAEHRDRGIGQDLMRFLAVFCRDHDIGRIDWVIETDKAQRFYERLGAATQPHKKFMRLDGTALGRPRRGLGGGGSPDPVRILAGSGSFATMARA